MLRFKTFLKNETNGWTPLELGWLVLSTLTIIALSLYWKDTPMGIVSAATGVACVVCTGKGKLSAYIFGLINCVLYAIIALQASYYGETMLNLLYYAPMQFYGFFVWSKHFNQETKEVDKRHMKNTQRLFWTLAIALSTVGYGFLLKHMGDAMPFVDSFTTVSSVAAMVVSIKMYAEQWWIWVIVDVFTIFMWAKNFINGNENIATLLMWIVYLVNAIIMLIKWEKEAKEREKTHEI